MEVRETVVPEIDPEVLAHLDPSLHPPGNTKVTTTIKTYTYEIPGSGDFPTNLATNTSTSIDNEKYVYSPNQSATTPSKSFVYNKIENKENSYYEQDSSYPLYKKPTPPGGVLLKETVTTRNYQPGYSPELNPPSSHQTYIYNENITTKNVNGYPPQPPPQPRQDTYIVKESSTTNINRNEPPVLRSYTPTNKETYILKETNTTTVNKTEPPFSERGYPVYNPPDDRNPPGSTTYILKETHNTTNRNVGPPYQNGYPPQEPGKTVIYKHETHTTNKTYGPGGPGGPKAPKDVDIFDPSKYGKPNEPINIHYSYKSTNTTENKFKGGYPPGDETQTLLPHKFPVHDGPDGPPKKLDDLMATIGNEVKIFYYIWIDMFVEVFLKFKLDCSVINNHKSERYLVVLG